MNLTLSLGYTDWEDEMWIEIFDRAKKKGRILNAQMGKYNFQYALINPKDGYQRESVSTTGKPYKYKSNNTFWIKDKEKTGIIGFACKGLSFVLERELTRQDFADYVGLHEHIESNFVGGNHGVACKVELEEVLKRELEFIDSYANWLITASSEVSGKGYFGRAIPDFLKAVKGKKLSPVQILKEFKSQLDQKY